MTSSKGTYVRIGDRAAQGKYELVDPFDYIILGKLPDEGSLMGGYYPIVTSVKELRTRHFPELRPNQISARLYSLKTQGLVVTAGAGNSTGWQRTTKGKELHESWQQRQSS